MSMLINPFRLAAGGAVTFDPAGLASGLTLSNGNLTVESTTDIAHSLIKGTVVITSKAYWEVMVDAIGSVNVFRVSVGCAEDAELNSNYLGQTTIGAGYLPSGQKVSGGSRIAFGASFATGDIAMVAYDPTTTSIWFGKNGTWTGDPAAGTGAAYAGLGFVSPKAAVSLISVDLPARSKVTARFAAASWQYVAPSGFAQI